MWPSNPTSTFDVYHASLCTEPQPLLIKSPQRAANLHSSSTSGTVMSWWDSWNNPEWSNAESGTPNWSHSNWENCTWNEYSTWKNLEGHDKYANVSTLGLKHPLPMEDRRGLVLGLLNKLQEKVPEVLSGSFRIAVSSWSPVLIHAVLFFLCRAKPCMPLRLRASTTDAFT